MTKMKDTEFEPVTEEDIAREAREAELARKIRREVLRVQRGDADEDIRQDEEQEQEQEWRLRHRSPSLVRTRSLWRAGGERDWGGGAAVPAGERNGERE